MERFMSSNGMRKMRWIFAVFVLVVPIQLAMAQDKGSSPQKAAMVNGKVITLQNLERGVFTVERYLMNNGHAVSPESIPEIRRRVLENLIDQELLYQETQKKEIKVEQAVIDEKLESLKKRYPSEQKFKEAMFEANLSEKILRSEIERNLAIQKYVDEEFVKKTKVTDAEKKAFYDGNPRFFVQPEQVRASHILIRVEPGASPEKKNQARQKLEAIRGRIEKGEDFEALAKEYSQCSSRTNGGDLGYITRGETVKSFEDVAFALEVGKLSPVVETTFGYHIIRVTDKKPERAIPFKEAEKDIEQHLMIEKVNKEKEGLVARLKQEAKVERFAVE
jgi:peptidyl-prolyl cis-trans isomerase C